MTHLIKQKNSDYFQLAQAGYYVSRYYDFAPRPRRI